MFICMWLFIAFVSAPREKPVMSPVCCNSLGQDRGRHLLRHPFPGASPALQGTGTIFGGRFPWCADSVYRFFFALIARILACREVVCVCVGDGVGRRGG